MDTIQISFALDRETHAKLQEIAKRQNRSMANLIKTLIKTLIKEALKEA